MKRKLFFLGMFYLLLGFASYSQQAYFSAGPQRIELKADARKLLVKVKKGTDANRLASSIEKSDVQVSEIGIGGLPFLLVESDHVKDVKIDHSQIDFKLPVYWLQLKKSQKFPTGRTEYFFPGICTNIQFSGLNESSFLVLIKFLTVKRFTPNIRAIAETATFLSSSFRYTGLAEKKNLHEDRDGFSHFF